MRKQLVSATMMVVILFACFSRLEAQVTIGANIEPDPNAALDIQSNGKWGLLLPRVKLTQTKDWHPLTKHVEGIVVYNTDTAGTDSTAVTPGYYYNDGSQWVRILNEKNAWQLYGNSNATSTSFLGTKNDIDLVFRRDSVQAGWLNEHLNNTSFGVASMPLDNSGEGNTAVGYGAMAGMSSHASNVSENGDANTAVGSGAMASNTLGEDNVAVGSGALALNIYGGSNTALGCGALRKVGSVSETNDNNIGIGINAGASITKGNSNILIGANIKASGDSVNNELNIGNVIYGVYMYNNKHNTSEQVKGKIGIGTNAPVSTLEVKGAATNTSSYAGTATNVDFSQSNLAYSAGTETITVSNTKDGGTYTLACTTPGAFPTLNITGMTVKTPVGAPTAITASQTTLKSAIVPPVQTVVFTIVCIGANAYVYPTIFN